jgi:hypothetical protein
MAASVYALLCSVVAEPSWACVQMLSASAFLLLTGNFGGFCIVLFCSTEEPHI